MKFGVGRGWEPVALVAVPWGPCADCKLVKNRQRQIREVWRLLGSRNGLGRRWAIGKKHDAVGIRVGCIWHDVLVEPLVEQFNAAKIGFVLLLGNILSNGPLKGDIRLFKDSVALFLVEFGAE